VLAIWRVRTQGKSGSDEELVDKIRREDTELYRETVGRYQQGLYHYLRHLTNRPDAQRIWCRIYLSMPTEISSGPIPERTSLPGSTGSLTTKE
jgi:hypothetical protein